MPLASATLAARPPILSCTFDSQNSDMHDLTGRGRRYGQKVPASLEDGRSSCSPFHQITKEIKHEIYIFSYQ